MVRKPGIKYYLLKLKSNTLFLIFSALSDDSFGFVTSYVGCSVCIV